MLPTIAQLCARWRNEDVHTEHVARLALAVFDATHAALGLAEADRPLLEAAARLHDLGYSVAAQPRAQPPGEADERGAARHPEVGAALVIQHGVRGFDPAETRAIAAIMRCHSGDWPVTLADPIFAAARLVKLGAILRVADGLDHGHVQDASIQHTDITPALIRVAVASPLFPFNLARANAKADLWNARCPCPIEFRPATGSPPGPTLTQPAAPPVENARRLLSVQSKLMTHYATGVIATADAEAVHELRVAVRRCRALLRAFARQLSGRTAARLMADLGELADNLSAARDHDVWRELLQTAGARAAVRNDPRWPAFWAAQQTARATASSAAQATLTDRRFAALRARLARFLRVELPALARRQAAPRGFAALARKRFGKALHRVRRRAHWHRAIAADKRHALRKRLRRARYLGDFFALQLNPRQAALVRRLKRADQALGRIHDLDAQLARLANAVPPPPRALVCWLDRRRAARLRELRRQWSKLDLHP